jgi:hypothetical protein
MSGNFEYCIQTPSVPGPAPPNPPVLVEDPIEAPVEVTDMDVPVVAVIDVPVVAVIEVPVVAVIEVPVVAVIEVPVVALIEVPVVIEGPVVAVIDVPVVLLPPPAPVASWPSETGLQAAIASAPKNDK